MGPLKGNVTGVGLQVHAHILAVHSVQCAIMMPSAGIRGVCVCVCVLGGGWGGL